MKKSYIFLVILCLISTNLYASQVKNRKLTTDSFPASSTVTLQTDQGVVKMGSTDGIDNVHEFGKKAVTIYSGTIEITAPKCNEPDQDPGYVCKKTINNPDCLPQPLGAEQTLHMFTLITPKGIDKDFRISCVIE